MQKISTFLWFDDQAEEAADFYVSVFPNSRIVSVARYGDVGPGPKGQVMVVSFELAGQRFTALNGGPRFQFTEAISLVVNVENQQELDEIWDKLLQGGGQTQACGWLKDKYGLSWQVTPTALTEYLQDKDPARANAVMSAMMDMVKLDLPKLKEAYEHAAV
jgi:predicted 3-demethylubiquinone-9 3-methyltransferase (glyoxalase superfamily)